MMFTLAALWLLAHPVMPYPLDSQQFQEWQDRCEDTGRYAIQHGDESWECVTDPDQDCDSLDPDLDTGACSE